MTIPRWFYRWGAALILATALVPAAIAAQTMAVYRDPTCGCCGAWIAYARANGYTVKVHEDQPMNVVKARLGVPASAASCHTALIGLCALEADRVANCGICRSLTA